MAKGARSEKLSHEKSILGNQMSLVRGALVPMLGLLLCDGCRDGGLDNQVATIITKVPLNTRFLRQKCLHKTSHALTNCTRGRCTAKLEYNGSAQYENPASLCVPLTDIKLHPEIFSHGVLHAVQASLLAMLDFREK